MLQSLFSFKKKNLVYLPFFDGHLGDSVPAYLQKHLFQNILKDVSAQKKKSIWKTICKNVILDGLAVVGL